MFFGRHSSFFGGIVLCYVFLFTTQDLLFYDLDFPYVYR